MWHSPCFTLKWERVGQLLTEYDGLVNPREPEKTVDLLERNRLSRDLRCRVDIVLTVQQMNFISYNPTQSEPTLSPSTERNSIGCEAWIDVSRFSSRENSARPINGEVSPKDLPFFGLPAVRSLE